MRQRLGIASALMGDPHVLVLDEPANGLDPAGIRWMRHLLRDFADRGGTVLLSSHLLNEVEVIADQLLLIDRGRLVASGSKEELLAGTGTLVRSPEPERLAEAMRTAGIAATAAENGLLADADPEAVGAAAHAGGAPLSELRAAEGAGLEQLFLSLTSGSSDGGGGE
jgi:ABC-2 type transport system ATP-binding protein